MSFKALMLVFATAFIAELGDKSQVLTLLYASSKQVSPWLVFAGVSLALVAATGVGVLAGNTLGSFVSEKILAWVAGCGFLVLGGLSIARALQL